MTPAELLKDAFARIVEQADALLPGLDEAGLTYRPGPEANSIAWLVWHLARVQDDHVADAAGHEQVWTSEGFVDRFGLPFEPEDFGFGHTSRQVAQVNVPAELLSAYLHAVHDRTRTYVETLDAGDLERIVDDRWDPPVTLGVRLVSVVNDGTEHVGQAAYVRGLLGSWSDAASPPPSS